ncbi:MAG: response regulator [Syntrophorhabdales bacterium]|jgi:CheY-like chemotaxis protein
MRSSRRLHILFVDDDESLLAPFTAVLERLGHTVTSRSQSLNGLRAFSDEPDEFDLAILDLDMPDLTGLELGQRFRRIRPGFPVMVYSGPVDSSTRERIVAEGMDHVVLDPKTADQLEAAVRAALR